MQRRTPWRWPVVCFVIGVLGYVIFSRLFFQMPVTLAEAEACGFTTEEFVGGSLTFAEGQAWRIRFIRQQEYLAAASLGISFGFLAFALTKVREIGRAASLGAAAGGGILAVFSLCVSCLGPTLSVVGFGLLGSLALTIPQWTTALSTLLFVTWGYLFLSRRAAACPWIPAAESACDRVAGSGETALGWERGDGR